MLEIVFYLMLLVTSTSQDNKIISIPIVTFLGRYNLKCNFGIEMGSKNLEINMDIDYLLISGNESQILAMKDSKIILNQTYLEFEGNQEKAFLCQSKITLINQNPLNMFYYLSTKYRLNDIFPLAYHYSNNAFSVIHSLYNTNEIDQLGFGFYLQRRLDEMEGFLYLGGIPNKLIEQFPYHKSCKVNSKYYQWGCVLQEIIINNITYISYEKNHFQSNIKNYVVPFRFWNFMFDNYFTKASKNANCSFSDSLGINLFLCPCHNLNLTLNIDIVLEGIILSLDQNAFMYTYLNKCILQFEVIEQYKDEWIFGTSFLNRYLTYFNYTKGEITFYQKKQFRQYIKPISNNNYTHIKSCLILNITLNVINILFIIIIS